MEAPGSVKEDCAVGALRASLAGCPGLELESDADLSTLSTFRIGGRAALLVRAGSEPGLERFVRECSGFDLPMLLLGQGSNVLIPDDAFEGIVLQLVGDFREITLLDRWVRAGAAVPLAQLAMRMARQGRVGLEALAGFPSSVGGAVYMNAGCYGIEIRDVLEEARVLGPGGRWRDVGVSELGAGYRTTSLQGTGAIVTRATFRLSQGDAESAVARIKELNRRRWSSLPSGRHAGSVFRNPEGEAAGRLIDRCGLKGHRRGEAQISDKHANVIVNLGGARAEDVFALMIDAWRAVKERHGIELRPEIELIGSLRERWRQATAAEESK
jgi:UDP-N-acetylmuramate dehydrogenase